MRSDLRSATQYAPAPAVTPLNGNETAMDARERATACWLVARYASRAYAASAQWYLGELVQAFDAWPEARERCPAELLQQWAHNLHDRQRAFHEALLALTQRNSEHAFRELLAAVRDIEPDDPRNERHLSVQQLSNELGNAVGDAGEKIAALFPRLERTLYGGWAREALMADVGTLSDGDRALMQTIADVEMPSDDALSVGTGDMVARTGIWIPTTVRAGCPNLLVAGDHAPELVRASVRYDHPPWPEVAGTADDWRANGWTEYEYITEPTVWQLLQ